jgi:hypothetical protein
MRPEFDRDVQDGKKAGEQAEHASTPSPQHTTGGKGTGKRTGALAGPVTPVRGLR